MVTLALLYEALNDAGGKKLLSAEIVEDQLTTLAQRRAIFFIGSMRERIVCRHHSSRYFAAQAGEL